MDLLSWAGLAATSCIAALLYAVSGFGFAVLAAPLFLLFSDPARAVQLVIIVSTALSLVVLPGLWRAIAPGLLARLALGSLAGLPIGIVAFRYADPVLVRITVGATILAFAALMAKSRRHWARHGPPLEMRPAGDIAAGAISGIATSLVGMAGPPVLIYLLLTGASSTTVRATLLAYFSVSYGATLVAHAATVGVPSQTWLTAGALIPFGFAGAFVGRRLGNRLGAEAFGILAMSLLAVAGLYTVLAAGASLAGHSQ
ncbi:MAG: sulfite exporter TauE/SafE family protein [Alphaproteobacteria bacterium]|nr:sulfite exporter TauE/SafE family protein [Alphaproteobacteria bacterium]